MRFLNELLVFAKLTNHEYSRMFCVSLLKHNIVRAFVLRVRLRLWVHKGRNQSYSNETMLLSRIIWWKNWWLCQNKWLLYRFHHDKLSLFHPFWNIFVAHTDLFDRFSTVDDQEFEMFDFFHFCRRKARKKEPSEINLSKSKVRSWRASDTEEKLNFSDCRSWLIFSSFLFFFPMMTSLYFVPLLNENTSQRMSLSLFLFSWIVFSCLIAEFYLNPNRGWFIVIISFCTSILAFIAVSACSMEFYLQISLLSLKNGKNSIR